MLPGSSASGSPSSGLSAAFGPVVAEPLALEVSEATLAYDSRNNQPMVAFRLSEGSRKAFADFSATHVGEKIDIGLNEHPVCILRRSLPFMERKLHIGFSKLSLFEAARGAWMKNVGTGFFGECALGMRKSNLRQ